MRNLFLRAALPVLISALFVSCEKKDDDSSNNGSGDLKIGNQSYELTSGSIWNYGEDNSYEGFELSVSLYSSGLTETERDNFAGAGLYVIFNIYSSSKDAFIEGEYKFRSYISGSFDAGTFAYPGYGRYNSQDENDYSWYDITAGTITIDKNGDTYSVTIKCTNAAGEEVNGSYTGKLSYGDVPQD